jgi:hypothetical protein
MVMVMVVHIVIHLVIMMGAILFYILATRIVDSTIHEIEM